MNSGFASFATRGKISIAGTHQKLDREAFRVLSPMINTSHFPRRREILKFEGYGGPDGMAVKGNYKNNHMWDPITETGFLPIWIESHYKNLVAALKAGDQVEAAFHAGYMAHYLTDSLTPAHHVTFEQAATDAEEIGRIRRNWKAWGIKGSKSSHLAFESGISAATMFTPLRVKADLALTEAIARDGIARVVKAESLKIAKLHLYKEFLKDGWTAKLAKSVRATVVPRIPQMIAAAWLAAYQEVYAPVDAKRLAPAAHSA